MWFPRGNCFCECGRIFFTNVEYTDMIPSKTIDQFEVFEFNLGLLKCASWDAAFLCIYFLIFMLLNLSIKQNVKFCTKCCFPQIPQVVFQAVGIKEETKWRLFNNFQTFWGILISILEVHLAYQLLHVFLATVFPGIIKYPEEKNFPLMFSWRIIVSLLKDMFFCGRWKFLLFS